MRAELRNRSDEERGENVGCRRYVNVRLALCGVRSGGGGGGVVNGNADDEHLSSPEPTAHGELVLAHYFFFCFLGGVTGRPLLMPP